MTDLTVTAKINQHLRVTGVHFKPCLQIIKLHMLRIFLSFKVQYKLWLWHFFWIIYKFHSKQEWQNKSDHITSCLCRINHKAEEHIGMHRYQYWYLISDRYCTRLKTEYWHHRIFLIIKIRYQCWKSKHISSFSAFFFYIWEEIISL